MPYCPDCRDEYQRGVTECPYCGAKLVDALNQTRAPGSPKVDHRKADFIRLRDFRSGVYAYVLQAALENEGIPSLLKDHKGRTISVPFDESSRFAPEGSVSVWVPKEDHGTSKEIADQMFEHI
jgi:hypothetical protein